MKKRKYIDDIIEVWVNFYVDHCFDVPHHFPVPKPCVRSTNMRRESSPLERTESSSRRCRKTAMLQKLCHCQGIFYFPSFRVLRRTRNQSCTSTGIYDSVIVVWVQFWICRPTNPVVHMMIDKAYPEYEEYPPCQNVFYVSSFAVLRVFVLVADTLNHWRSNQDTKFSRQSKENHRNLRNSDWLLFDNARACGRARENLTAAVKIRC